PINTKVAVRPSDDPYKKYWWLILVGFAFTAGWLTLPMMEPSVGSTRIDTSAPTESMPLGEGSLDGSDNPNGAPGSTLDLAMDVHRPKKADGTVMSSLYQAPDEPAAPVEAPTAGAAAAGGTLASALKAAATSDPSGWGGQKAQKGFAQPKLGGSMPGLGGGGSGGSAPSFSAGGRVGAFGSQNSSVGSVGTTGLQGSVSDLPEAKNARGALANAAQKAQEAARLTSNDGKVSSLSALFDGRKGGGTAIGGGPGGQALGAGGVYESLDSAPTNLKMNDPELDKREFKEPPAQVANSQNNMSDQFKQQMAMMIVTTVVGGMIPGPVGTALTSLGPMLAQMYQTQQRGSGTTIGNESGSGRS
ncbi:MAG: hypothetical protein SF051_00870, partial [Elusimicrobiota bacterium]|nr:hypothetical protein [Elusimicrobiota bacterium]